MRTMMVLSKPHLMFAPSFPSSTIICPTLTFYKSSHGHPDRHDGDGSVSNIKCDNDDQVEMFQKVFLVIIWMILVIATITIISLLIWSWWCFGWWQCCWCPYELLRMIMMMMMMMKVDVVVVPFPSPSFVPSQHFSNHLVMTQNIRQPLLSASPPQSIMSISSGSFSVYMCKFISKCTKHLEYGRLCFNTGSNPCFSLLFVCMSFICLSNPFLMYWCMQAGGQSDMCPPF